MEGTIVQAIIGLIGESIAKGEREDAARMLAVMQQQFANIPLPSLEEIEAIQLGESEMEGVTTDPRLEASQYDALGGVSEIADDGMSAVDTAALNRIGNQVARRQKAGMAGIESDMAARGQAGTGMDYALRAQAASDANQRLSEEGQNVGAEAMQRRYRALMDQGDMSGKMRGQQFAEKSKKAEAADMISRLNAASRSQAQSYNATLPQQKFKNQLTKTAAVANPTNAMVGMKVDGANDTRNAFAQYGAAAGKAVESASNYYDDDDEEDKKK